MTSTRRWSGGSLVEGGGVAAVVYVRVLSIPPAVEVNCHARILLGGSMLNWNDVGGMMLGLSFAIASLMRLLLT